MASGSTVSRKYYVEDIGGGEGGREGVREEREGQREGWREGERGGRGMEGVRDAKHSI